MGIKGTFHRKPSLSYGCPHCGERLKSLLMDAGTEDTCPHCQQVFTVPGEKEKQEHVKKEKAKAELEGRRAAEKQRAESEWLANQEAETKKFQEQFTINRKREIAQHAASEKALRKAMPAGLLPAVMAVTGGLIFFYFAIAYDTSVSTESSAYGGPSRINNLGLLQNRLIGCITGVALFVGGVATDLIARAVAEIQKDRS